jgi:hypothetical protein
MKRRFTGYTLNKKYMRAIFSVTVSRQETKDLAWWRKWRNRKAGVGKCGIYLT